MPNSKVTKVSKDQSSSSESDVSLKAKKQMPNSKVTKVSKDQSSSSESDVDVDCMFCGNNYSKDRGGEGWIMCCMFCGNNYSKDRGGEGWIMCCHCGKWAHDACAGVGSNDDDEFTCDLV
ncbi:hypothetical protein QE152_g5377 [Popillia japonica]|uniref:Uncharacterized protein n=1 Tax=Popillia japonica TaxID=7064 RepID=A0AAW1MNT2_POPJA